ncbi:MAG: PAS domain S-box protein [Deltaproteobacteria bacterium]|nr:PAS domain S-box protein [Deltaproteobacteria bacterium]
MLDTMMTRPDNPENGSKKGLSEDPLYRCLYESSVVGIILTDSRRVIVAMNPAASRMLGYGRQELIGHTIEDLVDKGIGATPSPGEAGHPRTEGTENLALLRKNGSSFPAEITWSPFSTGNDAFTALFLHDITDRRKAENTLRENETRLRILFENTMDIIALLNPDGTIRYHSPAAERLLGYTTEELSRMVSFDLLHPEDRERIMTIFMDTLQKPGTNVTATFRVRHYDGTWRSLDAIGSNLLDNPAVQGFVLNARDVTERRKLEAVVLQAQKMEAVGTLAGGIAHEINNLLMGIQGNASLLQIDMNPQDPGYERLLHIQSQVRSGANLTQQLLGFARKGRYEVKPADLNVLIQMTAEVFGRTKKEIRIEGRYAEDLWCVEVDAGQIEQVLLNLYINGWQAMPAGGKLRIETRNMILDQTDAKVRDVSPGPYAQISVTDTGVGMDEKTKARIFEPFFTTRVPRQGKGLGLAAAYGIIRGHRGYISAASEVGHGTTVTICLPASNRAIVRESKIPPKGLQGQEKILIVDDELFIIDVTQDILKTFGYEVLTAKSGEEAIRIYREQQRSIDLVILDMIMPEMGGGEVFGHLKAINPQVRVILASGYSINGQAQRIMEQGCRAFLQKPFGMDELSRKIREVLDRP